MDWTAIILVSFFVTLLVLEIKSVLVSSTKKTQKTAEEIADEGDPLKPFFDLNR